MSKHSQNLAMYEEDIIPAERHHPHHSQQGPPPHTQHLQHPRPPSIVHHQGPPSQHSSSYPPSHNGLPQHSYGQSVQNSQGHHPHEINQYYGQPSPYSTASGSGTYNSSAAPETPEIMAAAQMSRPAYPSIYQTPQSNSPASVSSPSGHDQHGRTLYGQSTHHIQQQPMYYGGPHQQYPPMPLQNGPAAYAPHAQQHQSMTSQPNSLLMTHQNAQHQMQHSSHQQQRAMTNSPRTKMEHVPHQQRPSSGPHGPPPQHQQQVGPPTSNTSSNTGSANPNSAPGPIPATTPLVVQQDDNGVQWIAFEYSRDRVKMEYKIRCDVESVNVDTLHSDFKHDNCVYPRACCVKEKYLGNRFGYESECNTVGWALAELNPNLRGKRGLIQRAVDSWRNSNQDPRLRSRRVRRMAKISTRKNNNAVSGHSPHGMSRSGCAPGLPIPSGNMGIPGGAGNLKSSMNCMSGNGGNGGQQLAHHHHSQPDGSASGGGDESSGNDSSYVDDETHHNHRHQHTASNAKSSSVKASTSAPIQQFATYPASGSAHHPLPNTISEASAQHARNTTRPAQAHTAATHPQNQSGQPRGALQLISEQQEFPHEILFGSIPEDKKRKFILVLDESRGAKVRVRVTLDTVDPKEIPDSYRKSNSVFPRSWFPVQMQSPPPSAGGSRFFPDDDDDDVGTLESSGRGKTFVQVPLPDGSEASMAIPRCKKTSRIKEVMINELGYRMTWHQSRVFAGRTVFLQKALDCYRNKVRSTMDSIGQDVQNTVPHFETRIGKRRLNERKRRSRRDAST